MMSGDNIQIISAQLLLRLAEDSSQPINKLLKTIISQKTNLAQVNIVYNSLKQYDLFPEMDTDAKNDEISAKFRQNGNTQYIKGNFTQALQHYTLSVATAKTSEAIALAYANRSACLLKLQLLGECLTDIKRALAEDYPDKLKEKLIKRQSEAESLLEPTDTRYHDPLPNIPDTRKNQTIQVANNSVKINQTKEFGRHIIATKDIEIGDVLMIEKPYAACVTGLNERLTHCHHCLTLCYNGIACKGCTQALFCGETCRDLSLNSYHKYECPILLFMAESDMINSVSIALKATLLAKTEYAKLIDRLSFNQSDCYCSDRIDEICCLNSETRHITERQLFARLVIVAMLFHMIKKTSDFFTSEAIENSFKDLLLSIIQITISNGVNIYEYARIGSDFQRNQFGGGLYSFFSLFNHSCCHNVEGWFYGSTVVLRAINTIKAGQQCFINYDANYGSLEKSKRQAMLIENFGFVCKCPACQNDWQPNFDNFLVNNLEIFDIEDKLVGEADQEFAEFILPHLVRQLRDCQGDEPEGNALTLKKMLCSCFATMGNTKRL